MDPVLHLIIHNISSGLSALALLVIAFFIFLNKEKTTASITIGFTALAAATFIISHAIGVSVQDPELSKNILMFNLSIFFIGAFNIHSVLAIVGKDKKYKWLIIFIYTFVLAISIFFIIRQDLFLLDSIPKMYFPNYYVPGIINIIRVIFLHAICFPYILYILIIGYRNSVIQEEKNRLKYFILMMISGYGIGLIPNLLVYDIQVDPLWGVVFAAVLVIPFLLGAVKHELFNIKVIAKQAFWYSLAIVIVGGIIILLNYSNQLIQSINPNFPSWVIPIISSVLAVTIGFAVWKRLRENDLLKYEFITTMTHKFRTPLTGIRWATENLSKIDLPEDANVQIGYIKDESSKLIELTSILMNVSSTENNSYEYQIKKNELSNIIEEVLIGLSQQIIVKSIIIDRKYEPGICALFDIQKTKFVIQVLIENAIHYTPEGGKIEISASTNGKILTFSVKDSGIGITKEDVSRLFSKFYRSSKARSSDTEGSGIGLYISKEILSHQGGKIWANSEGENKGSVFTFTLPVAE